MTFDELNLNKPLLLALIDLEYLYPTPIQERAFQVIMSGRNVVGIAQTGTGKTFAYLLPLLRQLRFSTQREPRILILAPTRVLVVQIVNEIRKLIRYSQFRVAGVYGDTNINTQKQLVYDGLDILVATPGRLIDLTFTGVLRLKSIQKLVIDEVDEMLSLGLRHQLESVLELLPPKRQSLMFSATLSPEVDGIIQSYIESPLRIEVDMHGTPIERIVQQAYQVPNFNTKANLLELLLDENPEISKILVFVNTKRIADRLYERLEPKYPDQISVIHSNKAHNTRITALEQFQDGTHRVLIATDIVARGMDIKDVTHVLNFELPQEPGDYIHRIGRTGRADRDGVAISFVSPQELEHLGGIEGLMRRPIPKAPLPKGLVLSDVLMEEEKPVSPGGKDYLKSVAAKKTGGAFHKKKEKNMKVQLGGPKHRGSKFEKLLKAKNSGKPRKTRF